MRVLMIDDDQRAGEPQRGEELAAAGYRVVRCHEPGEPAFPCAGLREGRHCPLDDETVDVVVAVHDRAEQDPGVRCALRRHVPLVLVEPPVGSPVVDWATTVVGPGGSLSHAVSDAPLARLSRHERAAMDTLREVLEIHGIEAEEATVEAVRRGRHVRVQLRPGVPLSREVGEMASVKVLGAVRAMDVEAAGISVALDDGR